MTTNGFDPLWISAINHALCDREASTNVLDIEHSLWDQFIGPMIDHIEDTASAAADVRGYVLAHDAQPSCAPAVVLTYVPKHDFLIDVLTTATEGGINYWARFTNVIREEADIPRVTHVQLQDQASSALTTYEISPTTIAVGLARLLSPTFGINSTLRANVLTGLVENDAGFIDVDGADTIVQAGLFGQLIYG